jgi:TolB protein
MKKLILVAVLTLISSTLLTAQSGQSEYIVFSRLTDGFWQLWRKDLSTHEEIQLTSSPQDKRCSIWLRDRKVLVYVVSNDDFYLLTIHGEEQGEILKDYGYIIDPHWLLNKEKLIFVKYRAATMDASDIWICNLDGSEKTILTTLPGLQMSPNATPDEKSIVFISGEVYGRYEIYRMDLDSRETTQLTDNKYMEIYPRVSPDGKSLAYASDESGNYDIWLSDLNGQNKRQITKDKSFDTYPQFSPGGDKIVFFSNRTGNLQIFTADVKTGRADQLTSGDTDSRDPIWIKMSGIQQHR